MKKHLSARFSTSGNPKHPAIAHRKSLTFFIAKAAMIAAVYAALTMAIPYLGFGIVQFRVSEALTVFAVISPLFVIGLTLGCFMANLLGVLLGLNVMPLDILFGTVATLVAALCSYALRNVQFKGISVFAWLPPVLINAIVIGAEFSFIYVAPDAVISAGYFAYNAITIGIGETICCLFIGMPLYYFLSKRINFKKYC